MGTTILDPTGQADRVEEVLALAHRPVDLSGRKVGLVNNGKQNAGVFIEQMAQLLLDQYGVGEVAIYKKPVATVEAPAEMLKELAAENDLVVIGVGDCGSCSAAAVADGIVLERLGTPAAVVCTESFRATADAMAALKGASGYQFATCQHPVAGLAPDQVHERVTGVADQVVGLLVDTTAQRGAA